MNVLVTCNENYLPPLKTMLWSLFKSNRGEQFTIYFMHNDMAESSLKDLESFIKRTGQKFYPIDCSDLFEEETIVNRYYSIEMYYRLLAPFVLPDEVDRILYLDPDIISLNPVSDFYHQDFKGNLFVATTHDYLTKWIQPINNIRLNTLESKGYFNTGILLMNLPAIRLSKTKEDIFSGIELNKNRLLLPDQDVFNYLYWDSILEADWRIYNLDPRYYSKANVIFPKDYNLEWVEKEVVFIHYCGKQKPWNKKEEYKYKLGHYYDQNEMEHLEEQYRTFDFVLEE